MLPTAIHSSALRLEMLVLLSTKYISSTPHLIIERLWIRWLNDLMFCWPCNIAYQYSETNVMHFLFNLLSIKGLYMFRALLAHPQEALHKPHLVYCMRVMSVGCTSSTSILVQPTDITRTQYTKYRSNYFEHYLLILRRCYTNDTLCIACVLCQLAAPGLKWNWCSQLT
jgi:hypothetical protein